MSGLLNPPQDATIARMMMDILRQELTRRDHQLLNVVMPPDKYALALGGRIALNQALDEMTKIYNREITK